MVKTTLTKSEIRQTLKEDLVVLWFMEVVKEKFEYEKNLIGAPDEKRLWEIKGHAEVIRFMSDIDRLLEQIDIDDE